MRESSFFVLDALWVGPGSFPGLLLILPFLIRGPGLYFVLPCLDRCSVVDLRTRTHSVPRQEVRLFNIVISICRISYHQNFDFHSVIKYANPSGSVLISVWSNTIKVYTLDGVTVHVSAVLTYRVVEARLGTSLLSSFIVLIIIIADIIIKAVITIIIISGSIFNTAFVTDLTKLIKNCNNKNIKRLAVTAVEDCHASTKVESIFQKYFSSVVGPWFKHICKRLQ